MPPPKPCASSRRSFRSWTLLSVPNDRSPEQDRDAPRRRGPAGPVQGVSLPWRAPQASGPVLAGGRHGLAVRCERDRGDPVSMSLQDALLLLLSASLAAG